MIGFTITYYYYFHQLQYSTSDEFLEFKALEALTEYNNLSYVIGWDFNEGQTCASRNLLGLLHWATTIKFYVVEPCVCNSFFNMAQCFSSHSNNSNSALYFRDYFDVDYWNQQIVSHKFGQPLVPWKDFISNIPQRAIVVYLWRQKGTKGNVLVGEKIDAPSCYHKTTRPQFANNTLGKFGIKIIREICIHYDMAKGMDVWWFNKQILGDFRPPDILILFAYWPGTFKGTVYFSDQSLSHKQAYEYLKPSQRVIEDSGKYQELFLGDSYIAIALRMAKIATHLSSRGMPYEKIDHYLNEDCVHQLALALEKFNGKQRLLALDLGRFGDGEAFDIKNDTVYGLVPKLVNIVYESKWNWSEWEDSFVQATGGIEDSGYIASMQKLLVANASCIIIAGAGDFQNSLIKNYKARAKHPCIHKVCVYT